MAREHDAGFSRGPGDRRRAGVVFARLGGGVPVGGIPELFDDGVEGVYVKTDGVAKGAFKLVGNVPANGKAPGGLLRHKGWKADKVELPTAPPASGLLAPAEIEVE